MKTPFAILQDQFNELRKLCDQKSETIRQLRAEIAALRNPQPEDRCKAGLHAPGLNGVCLGCGIGPDSASKPA